MGSLWGRNLKISLFGESHGAAIGVNIDGLPSGYKIDLKWLAALMQRRQPGRMPWSTPRTEKDEIEILSGLYRDKTSGTPLCVLIRNKDQHSADYQKEIVRPRPGHADLPGKIRYKGFEDPRGGGHFSGRLTAPLTVAGGICEQILAQKGIYCFTHVASIGSIQDEPLQDCQQLEHLRNLADKKFPVFDLKAGERMIERILAAKEQNDSVGGVVEGVICGLPAGLGDPYFARADARLASLLMGIPAVKGVELGKGFAATLLYGSEHNDQLAMDNGEVRYLTNNAGGVLGGITTGEPMLFRAAFKPTSSIGRKQQTVDLKTKETVELEIVGRHDPCIVPRAVPVVQSAAALFALDLLLDPKE